MLFNLRLIAQTDNTKGLKDYYADYFPIGVSVSPGELRDSLLTKLVLQQFNSITPENAMKWGQIHHYIVENILLPFYLRIN